MSIWAKGKKEQTSPERRVCEALGYLSQIHKDNSARKMTGGRSARRLESNHTGGAIYNDNSKIASRGRTYMYSSISTLSRSNQDSRSKCFHGNFGSDGRSTAHNTSFTELIHKRCTLCKQTVRCVYCSKHHVGHPFKPTNSNSAIQNDAKHTNLHTPPVFSIRGIMGAMYHLMCNPQGTSIPRSELRGSSH